MVLADLTSPLGWVFYHNLFEKNRLVRRWTRVRFPAAVKLFHFLITCSYLSIKLWLITTFTSRIDSVFRYHSVFIVWHDDMTVVDNREPLFCLVKCFCCYETFCCCGAQWDRQCYRWTKKRFQLLLLHQTMT